MNAEPTDTFGSRLGLAFRTFGRLCVGIDPHPWLLDEWGIDDTADGAREFGLRVVDAAAGRVGIVKPQVAFFERFGSTGYRSLEAVLAAAKAGGLLVIADVKRGDVGTSVEAYGRAWFARDASLEADAITVSAYLGFGSLEPVIALAAERRKGLFVLAATSNPEGAALQGATIAEGPSRGGSVAGGIVADVIARNSTEADDGIASIGVVLGATVDLGAFGIRPDLLAASPATPVLAPGFGHQGARFDRLAGYGAAAAFTIVSVSRSILSAGPGGIVQAIAQQSDEVAACLA